MLEWFRAQAASELKRQMESDLRAIRWIEHSTPELYLLARRVPEYEPRRKRISRLIGLLDSTLQQAHAVETDPASATGVQLTAAAERIRNLRNRAEDLYQQIVEAL